MLLLAFRSFFFVAVILGYSTGVWRLINDYFRRGFKDFLAEEVKRNKYLVEHPGPEQQGKINSEPLTASSEPKQSSGSVTANRLLDELIVSFGRLFTASSRNERQQYSQRSVPPHHTDQPPVFAKPTISDNPADNGDDEGQARKTSSNPATDNTPDPGGTPATTSIDGRKTTANGESKGDNEIWSTSSSSASAVDPEDDKWLSYWRRKQIGNKVAAEEIDGGGHCEAAVPAGDNDGDIGCHP
ncbi:uncharacterized protein LOC129717903 [Wyeomyia smithii]|uniref:uncharacterized protein LOC129717903 n=1 Tax=Wyeomyia smithii TaxID=174621 RepID=UPI002467DE0B|nr:uncharacterized protein LOC129717903 [Wyeomyia smithii]